LARKKIYFASDLHLGAPNHKESLVREKRFVSWLDNIKDDAKELYIIGDVFDFWFEYKTVIPKGFVRLFAKLLELRNLEIPITIIRGNHDMWMFGYLEKELGIQVIDQNVLKVYSGKKFFIGHGDGLGPGDPFYKIMKALFKNSFCVWLFKWIHPDIGIGIANFWSKGSRSSHKEQDEKYLGEDKEWLIVYSKEQLKKEHQDYFIFGHRHLPLDIDLGQGSRYVNTGDWLKYYSYAVFDGEELILKYYKN
jgi:UDP-2,3-diacylglucosamine hydrolase